MSPFVLKTYQNYLLFLLTPTLIFLSVGSCTDSVKRQNRLTINSEIVLSAIDSVIEKANGELTKPHSKLIFDNRNDQYGPREYVSLATYWWPNPDTENSLPYIRKDGQINPETMTGRSNLPQLIRMARRIETFSAAYRFTDNEIYAKRAVEQLKIWFNDPETSMLPHLEHAQMIRGIDEGRSYGVIDTWWLVRVVDSFLLLSRSEAWSNETDRRLKEWFTHYVNWLRNSSFGESESAQKNNHGTWYDSQLISFSMFIDWNDFALQHLDSITRKRVGDQILFSGRQKHEASRTRPEHYNIYNLYGLLRLARIAKEKGLDISEPEFLFSGSLRDAYEYLVDQIALENPANFTEVFDETDTARIWYLLLMEAALLFEDPSVYRNFEETIIRFPELHSRYVSANPELFLQLINQKGEKFLH